MSASVVIYNLGGEERLGRTSLNHAMTMIYKGIARVHTAITGEHFGPFERPTAIELTRYVVAKWKYNRTGNVPFTKRGCLQRDNYTCCYCGGRANTVDHVLPKWQGNALTWTNAVAACRPCNTKKGGRSPREAGMKMLFNPRTPTFAEAYSYRRDRDK